MLADAAAREAGAGQAVAAEVLGHVHAQFVLQLAGVLGQPQDLLDPRAQSGQGGPLALLQDLVLVGQALLGLGQRALRVVHPLLGLAEALLRLSPRNLRLMHRGLEPGEPDNPYPHPFP